MVVEGEGAALAGTGEAGRTGLPPDLRAFFDDALRSVYSYLFHRCGGDRALAEDLTQETFLGAIRHYRAGRVEHLTTAWLMTVAQSRLVDHYRRLAREERKLALAWSQPVEVEPSVDATWSQERTLRALDALPSAQRAALTLHYLDRLPVADVARALGRSSRAVESLLARGRHNFRSRYLEEQG